MLEIFLTAVTLGFIFNAAPGAVFAETLRRGLAGGFRPALDVQIGSLAGDLVWAVLGLSGIGLIMTLPAVDLPLSLLGSGLLLWLAAQSLRDAMRPMPEIDLHAGASGSAVAVGAGLSLSNPMNVTYWAALGSTVGLIGGAEPTFADYAVFLAGFILSSVLWCVICATGVAMTRRHVGQRGWVAINGFCALSLAVFAVVVAVRAVERSFAAPSQLQ